ncbi:MAG: TonB-dependent receptor, partial [Flavobacteriales bacterium]
SNRFLYKESVNAAYANITKELNATTFQLGLRTEYTRTEGQSTTLNSKISRNYIDFFPSVGLNHTLNKKSTIGFTYSRRIDRPDYQSLNPFVYFSDLYTTSQGNPMLKPQYANSFELNYSLKKFNFSLAYISTKNVITTTLLTDTVKKSILLFEQNLAARKTISFNVSRSVNFTNWWSANNDATIYNSGFSSPELMGLPFENKKTTIELSTTHSFKFAPTLNAELAASYASSQVYGTYIAKPIYGLDLGISKSFADDRASIKFAVNDLFDQRRIAIKSAIQSQDYQLLQKQESRVFRLTFNYNFGSNLIKVNRDRSNSSTDEQSRLRKGN